MSRLQTMQKQVTKNDQASTVPCMDYEKHECFCEHSKVQALVVFQTCEYCAVDTISGWEEVLEKLCLD